MMAVKIEPNGKPYLVGIEGSIAEELHLLQQHVGGYIETVSLRDGGVMLVDEDGRMKSLVDRDIERCKIQPHAIHRHFVRVLEVIVHSLIVYTDQIGELARGHAADRH